MSIGRKLLASGLPRRRSRVLYVVGADGPLRGRIEATVRSIPDELRSARALGDVQVQTMRESAGVVILADESDLDVCSVASLRAYRSQDSATPILLATQLHPRTLHQLSACARAGLDAFYIVDDPAALRTLAQVATRHLTHALPLQVVEAIVPSVSSEGDAIATLCLRAGHRPHSAEGVSTWLHWDRKTIYRKLAQQNLRPIHDIIGVGRLVHAALHLDESEASISSIARDLHFDSASTLRRLCGRETHCAPKELRTRGAIRTVVAMVKLHGRGSSLGGQ